MSKFNVILKKLRLQENLTQQELADKIGVAFSTISMYERGQREPGFETLELIADFFNVDMNYLLGKSKVKNSYTDSPKSDIPMSLVPVLGRIAAGVPLYAEQNLEGYEYAPIKNGDEYFYLRVQGDSMKNANIQPGYKVLIKKQACAENGQIVACIVDGEDATLKRYREKQDIVILQPENSDYEPIIVPKKDFDSGEARIVGVVKSVQFDLG